MSEHQKNTKFVYMYRDGDNYKVTHSVIFPGAISLDMRDQIQRNMIDGPEGTLDAYSLDGFFIPGIVGLMDLQDQFHVKELDVLNAILDDEEGPKGPDRERFEELRDQMAATKPMWSDQSDHIYHTIEEISLTDAHPTDLRDIADFVKEMADASWNPEYLPPCYEVMNQNFLKAQDDPGFDNL